MCSNKRARRVAVTYYKSRCSLLLVLGIMRSLPINYTKQFVFAPFSTYFESSKSCCFFSVHTSAKVVFFSEVPVHKRSIRSDSLQCSVFPYRLFPYFFANICTCPQVKTSAWRLPCCTSYTCWGAEMYWLQWLRETRHEKWHRSLPTQVTTPTRLRIL